jgi:hypothetical protein
MAEATLTPPVGAAERKKLNAANTALRKCVLGEFNAALLSVILVVGVSCALPVLGQTVTAWAAQHYRGGTAARSGPPAVGTARDLARPFLVVVLLCLGYCGALPVARAQTVTAVTHCDPCPPSRVETEADTGMCSGVSSGTVTAPDGTSLTSYGVFSYPC